MNPAPPVMKMRFPLRATWASLAAVGGRPAYDATVLSAAVAAASLTITVVPGNGDATRHHTLRCGPAGGTLPMAAKACTQLAALRAEIAKVLPEAAPLYPDDDLTDRDERFLAAEFIREKIFRLLGDEVPYATTVGIDKFELDGALRRVHATVYVDKPGQRAILLGAAINLAFALIDVGGWLLHAGDLLSFIRNANYRMLDDATVGGGDDRLSAQEQQAERAPRDPPHPPVGRADPRGERIDGRDRRDRLRGLRRVGRVAR